MDKRLLTVNRCFKLEDSFHLIERLRAFVQEAKDFNPGLNKYQLYDIGFVPKMEYILVKLYFYESPSSGVSAR